MDTYLSSNEDPCGICYSEINQPKTLSCRHTFCELCLHDFVVSRGYESSGKFPCPSCGVETSIPFHDGVHHQALPHPTNNTAYWASNTNKPRVDQLQPPRPVPKPRRSLGQTNVDSNSTPEPECTPGPDGFEMVEEKKKSEENDNSFPPAPPYSSNSPESPPPPYSSVADSHPDVNHAHQKVCSNDTTDQEWMVVPGQNFTSNRPHNVPHSFPTGTGTATHNQVPFPQDQGALNCAQPVGWNIDALGPSHPRPAVPTGYHHQPLPNRNLHQSPVVTDSNQEQIHSSHRSSSPLYPSVPVPMNVSQDSACAENLVLRFGKQGSTARDFIRPIGLAVSREGHYIISDNGGGQNRFLLFNSAGEIISSFKCGCKVKDIAVTQNNEIIAAIHKANTGFRRFTLNGQLKGEYGRFFTFEETCGIAEQTNGGIVLTGVAGHCVYVLSDQMKLQTKFGRKGNGNGYFNHAGFVAVDSENNIIVSDKENGCLQVFNSEGKFKHRIGSTGTKHGELHSPMGISVDSADNIIVADSGNFRVEAFSSRGNYLCSVVRDTWQLGEDVKPVNVSVTPTGKVAVLLRGPYFTEVRVYTSNHTGIPQNVPNYAGLPIRKRAKSVKSDDLASSSKGTPSRGDLGL